MEELILMVAEETENIPKQGNKLAYDIYKDDFVKIIGYKYRIITGVDFIFLDPHYHGPFNIMGVDMPYIDVLRKYKIKIRNIERRMIGVEFLYTKELHNEYYNVGETPIMIYENCVIKDYDKTMWEDGEVIFKNCVFERS